MMVKFKLATGGFAALLFAAMFTVAGCGQGDQQTTHNEDEQAAETAGGHEWWCDDHGVLEDECTRCNASLIAVYQEKGDWCEEHDRPESQCFICNPEFEAKFAARYEAKYGKKPPKPEAE